MDQKSQLKKKQGEQPVVVPSAPAGSKEKEAISLEDFRSASLESAARQAEEIKEKLSQQGLVPHHDQPLEIDEELKELGASHPPLHAAEENFTAVNIPMDEFQLKSKRPYPATESIKWLKTKMLWIYKRAFHLGQRILFRGKPPQSQLSEFGV